MAFSYSLPPSGYSPYLRGRVWLGEVAAKRRLGNSVIGSRERLEGFVGIGVAFAPEDGLDGFGDNCPVLFEVFVDGFTVDDEFVEPFEGGFHRDDGVCEGHANVAEHGGVREVALEA